MKRKTHDDYVKELYDVNCHLHIKSKYVNSRTKVVIEDDRCHHQWSVAPFSPLMGIGCPYCSKRHKRTYDEFIHDLYEINKNIIILTKKEDYKNSQTKVLCKCKIDNHEWFAVTNSLLMGGGCPRCYGYMGINEFVKILSNTKPNIVLHGNYLGSKTTTKFRCLLDGFIWETQPYHILHDSGCPKCASKKQSERQLYSNDKYLMRLRNVTNDIVPVEAYSGHYVKILHVCKRCGHEWNISPNVLIVDRCGCPKCHCSKGEERIIKFLEDNHIKYIFQKTFDDLKYINSLHYDFYIEEKNILIEYDGEFHYYDIFKNGSFEKSIIRDTLKTEYAQKNNIKLIRIPYWDFNNIETILMSQL